MTTIQDRLDEAVADVHADLPALLAGSRNHGLSLRRRRRALAVVGSVAAVTLVAAVGTALTPSSPRHPAVAAHNDYEVGRLSGRTAPITQVGVMAALASQVHDAVDGRISQLRGTSFGGHSVQLLLEPGGQAPAGVVQLNLYPLSSTPPRDRGCGPELGPACSIQELANGDHLRTYIARMPNPDGPTYVQQMAEVFSPARGEHVLVFAANTSPSDMTAAQPQPVLTTEQLTAIATQPWWELDTLPVEYVTMGRRLEGYVDQ